MFFNLQWKINEHKKTNDDRIQSQLNCIPFSQKPSGLLIGPEQKVITRPIKFIRYSLWCKMQTHGVIITLSYGSFFIFHVRNEIMYIDYQLLIIMYVYFCRTFYTHYDILYTYRKIFILILFAHYIFITPFFITQCVELYKYVVFWYWWHSSWIISILIGIVSCNIRLKL